MSGSGFLEFSLYIFLIAFDQRMEWNIVPLTIVLLNDYILTRDGYKPGSCFVTQTVSPVAERIFPRLSSLFVIIAATRSATVTGKWIVACAAAFRWSGGSCIFLIGVC